jgi:hypothetical protein
VRTDRVSSEFLNKVLDIVAQGNGLRPCEIAVAMKRSPSAISCAVDKLTALQCISTGAVQFMRKNGTETLHKGYFYEQDLPAGFKSPKRMQRRKEPKCC